ncbi:hypothetical protein [Lyngbya confervoides]|uniref:Uncharacterized protein n=1 Tax=Lyngbya confervoides BDU141951 TaxID=1574623 RepID=A0ABD4T6B4_9CYAN|nr:hypothetical protein [Lyngbya confervoides]MCM1983983.1 hypothetical protein [Lyngbya confervoides BDU141951]
MTYTLANKAVHHDLSFFLSQKSTPVGDPPDCHQNPDSQTQGGQSQPRLVSLDLLNALASHFRHHSELKEEDALLIQLNHRPVFFRQGSQPESFKDLQRFEHQMVQAFMKAETIQGSIHLWVNESDQPAYHLDARDVLCNAINYQAPEAVDNAWTTALRPSDNSPRHEPSLAQELREAQAELATTKACLADVMQRLELLEAHASQQTPIPVGGEPHRAEQLSQTRPGESIPPAPGDRPSNPVRREGLNIGPVQLRNFAKHSVTRLKQAVKRKIDQSKQALVNQVNSIQRAIAAKIHQGQQSIASVWMSVVIEPSLATIANSFGTDLQEGGKVLQTKRYQITQKENETHIVRQASAIARPAAESNLQGNEAQGLPDLTVIGHRWTQHSLSAATEMVSNLLQND